MTRRMSRVAAIPSCEVEWIGVAEAIGDIGDAVIRGREEDTSALQPLLLMPTRRRQAELAAEQPVQLGARAARDAGQAIERYAAVEMRAEMGGGAGQARVLARGVEIGSKTQQRRLQRVLGPAGSEGRAAAQLADQLVEIASQRCE